MASDTNLTLDVSLRLWSDAVDLAPIVARLDLPAQHLHVIGQPMATSGPLKDRPARRHYASLAQARIGPGRALRAWLADVTARVRADPFLVATLQSGDVEGTIWLAVLGAVATPAPGIDTDETESVRRLGLGLLIENYTDIEDETGLPRKTWVVEVAA